MEVQNHFRFELQKIWNKWFFKPEMSLLFHQQWLVQNRRALRWLGRKKIWLETAQCNTSKFNFIYSHRPKTQSHCEMSPTLSPFLGVLGASWCWYLHKQSTLYDLLWTLNECSHSFSSSLVLPHFRSSGSSLPAFWLQGGGPSCRECGQIHSLWRYFFGRVGLVTVWTSNYQTAAWQLVQEGGGRWLTGACSSLRPIRTTSSFPLRGHQS